MSLDAAVSTLAMDNQRSAEDRTRASSEGGSSQNESRPLFDDDYSEEGPPSAAKAIKKIESLKDKATEKTETAMKIFKKLNEQYSVTQKLQLYRANMWQYLPFIAAGIPCLMILAVPAMAIGVLLLVAALPALCITPALTFALLPLAWPYIKSKAGYLPVSDGVFLSLCILMIPVCSLGCLPVILFAPIALLCILPTFILAIPALLLFTLPALFCLCFVLGTILLLTHSPVASISKQTVARIKDYTMANVNPVQMKAYWIDPTLQYLKLSNLK